MGNGGVVRAVYCGLSITGVIELKSIYGFAALIGFVVLGMLGLRLLNTGAIERTKNGTTFNHNTAVQAVWDTVKPFEENASDLSRPRRGK